MVLRALRAEDSDEILRWRNDETTRAMSLTTDLVDPATHAAWFSRLLRNEARIAYMATNRDDRVGWVRFDPLNDEPGFLASITIAPEMRGKGFGTVLLGRALKNLRVGRDAIVVHAQIKRSNIGSRKIFEQNGFKHHATDGSIETFALRENLGNHVSSTGDIDHN